MQANASSTFYGLVQNSYLNLFAIANSITTCYVTLELKATRSKIHV